VLVERERPQTWQPADGAPVNWTERSILIRALHFSGRLFKHVERRWQHAQKQLDKLCAPRPRGRRYSRSYESLWKTVRAILQEAKLEEIVEVAYRQKPLPGGKSHWGVTH
jgi:hypothetical protein